MRYDCPFCVIVLFEYGVSCDRDHESDAKKLNEIKFFTSKYF